MNKAKQKGFTLIELLVVIVIIAVLAAILFPVFARAKETAGKAACLNNLKQLGSAQLLYRDVYNDRLPLHVSYLGGESGYPTEGDYWTYYMLLSKYTRTKGGSFVCPQAVLKAPRTDADGNPIYTPGAYSCKAGIDAYPGTIPEQQKFFKDNYGYVYNGKPYEVTSYAAFAYPRNCGKPRSEWNLFVVSSYYSKQSRVVYMLEATTDLIYWDEAVKYTADEDRRGRLAPRHDGGHTIAVMFFDGHCKALDKKYVAANYVELLAYDEHLD